jgi:DNA repair protein RecN (Recombination protein N)
MLTSLSIKNIAIIDELNVDFERGFNVMTGETGAGKTIVVQALSLVLGARANAEYIRTGEPEAAVAATFLIDGMSSGCAEGIKKICESNGIDVEDELIIRRVISVEGRGKITVNGVPVTVQMLKDIACHLVDVSSQHENQLLIDPSNHVQLVDDFGVSKQIREIYAVSYSNYSELRE